MTPHFDNFDVAFDPDPEFAEAIFGPPVDDLDHLADVDEDRENLYVDWDPYTDDYLAELSEMATLNFA